MQNKIIGLSLKYYYIKRMWCR